MLKRHALSSLRFHARLLASTTICLLAAASAAHAQADADELAQKLANPISSLISVPFQFNADYGAGPDGDGERYTLNVQPVVPLSIAEDWNLIVRTIIPFVYQDDIVDDGGFSQSGLGDTVQSFFFSPKEPGPGGAIWGVGPVLLWPTASNDSLGTEQWGAGPTGVVLFQKGPWTYGLLANHIWDYAGDSDRGGVNASFVQPFLNWGGLGEGQTLALNMESTYDWEAEQWTAPLNFQYSKVTSIGDQLISWQIGIRSYLDAPDNGPDWGLRAAITLLFPR